MLRSYCCPILDTHPTLQLMHCTCTPFAHPRTTGGPLAESKMAPAQEGELRPVSRMLGTTAGRCRRRPSTD